MNNAQLKGPFGTAEAFCDALFAFIAIAGQSRYDQTVTQLEHGLQAAALAEATHYDETIQIAALLHDIGHLLLDEHDARKDFLSQNLSHEIVGARFLTRWFGPDVGRPVALHVKAKRYLVAVDPGYAQSLSAASTRSLQLQGGPMTTAEAAEFLRLPHAQAAIALRRCDDAAKEESTSVPGLDHWHAAASRRVSAHRK
jgi:phosphonate degradation associated HDIG domain protein